MNLNLNSSFAQADKFVVYFYLINQFLIEFDKQKKLKTISSPQATITPARRLNLHLLLSRADSKNKNFTVVILFASYKSLVILHKYAIIFFVLLKHALFFLT